MQSCSIESTKWSFQFFRKEYPNGDQTTGNESHDEGVGAGIEGTHHQDAEKEMKQLFLAPAVYHDTRGDKAEKRGYIKIFRSHARSPFGICFKINGTLINVKINGFIPGHERRGRLGEEDDSYLSRWGRNVSCFIFECRFGYQLSCSSVLFDLGGSFSGFLSNKNFVRGQNVGNAV